MVQVVRVTLDLLTWLIVARALLTWMPNIHNNPVTKFIHEITEPVMSPIEKVLPYTYRPFSPIVAILAIRLVERVVIGLMISLM